MSEPTSFSSERRSLRLTIVTPLQVVIDLGEVWHVRAEDATGSFGILPGHADFLTVLTVSVLIYRRIEGSDSSVSEERFVGLRGGVLQVTGGRHIQIFTREATLGEDLHVLSTDVKQRQLAAAAQEAEAHKSFARLEGSLLHHMTDYLRDEQVSGSARRRLVER
jgi:F-type H+-transporting ATPase subunit epsilon